MAHTAAHFTNPNVKKSDYEHTPLALLAETQVSIEAEAADVEKRLVAVKQAIARRVAAVVLEAREALDKPSGTVRAVVEGCEVVSDLPKAVKWDTSLLMKAADAIREMGEDPQKYIEIKLSVAERKYEVLSDAISKLIIPARTLSYNKEKIVVTPVEN